MFAKVTEEFKDQIYYSYLEDFMVKEISVEEFVDDFMQYWDTNAHRSIDDTPSMRPTS